MDDNPYKSPQILGPAEPRPATWHPLTWTLIGLVGGSLVIAPFLLSVDLEARQGGMMVGGIIGAIWGLAYGIKRRR